MNSPVPLPAFDLDDAVQNTSADLQLKDPRTGKAIGVWVTLAGPEHDLRRQHIFARVRRNRARFAKDGIVTTDPEADADEELSLLVKCTLGWRGMRAGGVDLEFSAGACTALYADPRRAWVRDQVKQGLDDRAVFYRWLRDRLTQHAELDVRLSVPEDGQPLRVHLESHARQTGRPDPQLAAWREGVPALGQPLWSVYVALANAQGDGPVPFAEIEAFQRLSGLVLTPWEVETLRAMDQAAQVEVAAARRKQQ